MTRVPCLWQPYLPMGWSNQVTWFGTWIDEPSYQLWKRTTKTVRLKMTPVETEKLTSQTCSDPQLILLRNFQLQLGVPHFQPAQQPVFPGSPNGVGRWRNFPGNQSIHHLCGPQATSGYCAAQLRSDPILGPSWTILKLQVKFKKNNISPSMRFMWICLKILRWIIWLSILKLPISWYIMV